MAKQKPKGLKKTFTLIQPADGSPIEITLKVIAEQPILNTKKLANFLEETLEESECPENKFTYTIATNNATILSLSLESFTKNNPGNSGEFTVCIDDATDEPKVHVIAMGKVDNPGGTANLQITFLGKPVFTAPSPFTLLNHGILMFNQLVKLP